MVGLTARTERDADSLVITHHIIPRQHDLSIAAPTLQRWLLGLFCGVLAAAQLETAEANYSRYLFIKL